MLKSFYIYLTFLLICPLTMFSQENNVIMGEGFQKNQQSSILLKYNIPAGWIVDEKGTEEYGLFSVLVPAGKSIKNSHKAITIAFQKKDIQKPGIDNLQNFFKVDMHNTLQNFPNARFEKWQPSGINPNLINFMSLEIFGEEIDKPNPHRMIIIDSGDGFYSISVTVKNRDELNQNELVEFLNSLSLVKTEKGMISLSMLLVKSREDAEEIIKRLKLGESFSSLVKKYSIGPAKEKGGDMGYLHPSDLMEGIREVAKILPIGEISDILEINSMYALLLKTGQL